MADDHCRGPSAAAFRVSDPGYRAGAGTGYRARPGATEGVVGLPERRPGRLLITPVELLVKRLLPLGICGGTG